MADNMDPQQGMGGLREALREQDKPIYGPYGADPETQQRLLQALEAQTKALEERYNKPNWGKIAAAFADPAPGGFFSAIGRVGGVLGEQKEQQRAQIPALAEMKVRTAQMQMLQQKRQAAKDIIDKHKGAVTPELAAEVTRVVGADDPMAQALSAQVNTQLKQTELEQAGLGMSIKGQEAAIAQQGALTQQYQAALEEYRMLRDSNASPEEMEAAKARIGILAGKIQTANDLVQQSRVTPPGKERFAPVKKAVQPEDDGLPPDHVPMGEPSSKEPEKPRIIRMGTPELDAAQEEDLAKQGKLDQLEPKEEEIPINPKEAKDASFDTYQFAHVPKGAMSKVDEKKFADLEAEAKLAVENLSKYADPDFLQASQTNTKTLLDFYAGGKENQKALERVTGAFTKFPAIMNAILKAADEGVHLSLGDMQGNLALPVSEFLLSFDDPQDRVIAQMVSDAIADTNLYKAKRNGLSQSVKLKSEAELMSGGGKDRTMSLDTILNDVLQMKNLQDLDQNLYEGYRSLMAQYAGRGLSGVAPTWQIMNSKWRDAVLDNSKEQARQIRKAFLSRMKGGRNE